MKIRNGFVSNSSSSSFCIFVDKNVYNEAIKNVHPFFKSELKTQKGHKFKDTQVVVLNGVYSSEDDLSKTWDVDDIPATVMEYNDMCGHELPKKGKAEVFFSQEEITHALLEEVKKIDKTAYISLSESC